MVRCRRSAALGETMAFEVAASAYLAMPAKQALECGGPAKETPSAAPSSDSPDSCILKANAGIQSMRHDLDDTLNTTQHGQLLEHQDFLRRLALGLVGDSQRADDLVQEVLRTSLQNPPRHSRNLRGWLGSVLVNRARAERRAEARRTRREHAVARDEALPPDEEAVERIELQRKLLDALSRLPEATRTAMVLRYYEGLTPLEIAARLQASPHTVKSQLRRGLEAMRVDLDRGHGGDRDRWVLALTPLTAKGITTPAAAAAAAAIETTSVTWLGTIIMATTMKWALAGAAIVIGAIAVLIGGGDGAQTLPPQAEVPGEHDRGAGELDSSGTALAGSPVPEVEAGARREEPRPFKTRADVLALRTLPALIVRDAGTGEGIEDFTLLSRDLPNNFLRDQGTFHAPGGRLTAANDPGLIDYGNGRRRFTVWAAGYEAKTVEEADFRHSSEVIVELVPGIVPSVRGVVMNRGLPVAGARVSLCPYRKLSWQPSELTELVSGTSDRRGGFELAGAPGNYVLRVICDAGSVFRPIELPEREPLTIEVGELASVTLVVRDPGGLPLSNIISILRPASKHSRNERLETDDQGRATFSDVEPGEWRVSLHGTQEHFHNQPWVEQVFTLQPGVDLVIQLAAPDPGQARRARLVVEGGSPSGWHAQMWQSKVWSPATAQGDIDIDLNLGSYVKLRSPEKAVWTWTVPPYTPGEDVIDIRVPAVQVAYRGRVLSRVDGTPLGGCEVFCYVQPSGGAMNTVAAATDADGRFVLPVSGDTVTALAFKIDGSSGGDFFTPNFAPSASPPLELRIFKNNTYRTDPHIPLTPVSGRVTDARDGTPVVEGYLRINAIFDDPQGSYSVNIDSSNSKTDADGRYSVSVPVADHYVARVWEEWGNDARKLSVEKGPLTQGAEAVWDLVLPGESK